MTSKFFRVIAILLVLSMFSPVVLGDLDATAKRVFSNITVDYHGASQLLPQNWTHELTYDNSSGTLSFPEDISFPLDLDDLDESYFDFFLDTGAKTHSWRIQTVPASPHVDDKSVRFLTTYTAPNGAEETCEEVKDLTTGKSLNASNCKIKFSAEWVSFPSLMKIAVPDADLKVSGIVFIKEFVRDATAEVLESTNKAVLDSVYDITSNVSEVIPSWNLQSPTDFQRLETAYAVPFGALSGDRVLVAPEEVDIVDAYIKKISGYSAWAPGIKFDSEGKKAPREYLVLDGEKPLFMIFANSSGDIQAYGINPGFENTSINSDIFLVAGKLNKTKVTTWKGWDRSTANIREDLAGSVQKILGYVAISSTLTSGFTYGRTKAQAVKFSNNAAKVFIEAAAKPVVGETKSFLTSGILHDGGKAYTVGAKTGGTGGVGPRGVEKAIKKLGLKGTVAQVTSSTGNPALRASFSGGVKAASKALLWIALFSDTAYLSIKFAVNKMIFVGEENFPNKMFYSWNEDVGNIEGRVMFLGVAKVRTERLDVSGTEKEWIGLDFANSITGDVTIDVIKNTIEFYSDSGYSSQIAVTPKFEGNIMYVRASELGLPTSGIVPEKNLYLKITVPNGPGKTLTGKKHISIKDHDMATEVEFLPSGAS